MTGSVPLSCSMLAKRDTTLLNPCLRLNFVKHSTSCVKMQTCTISKQSAGSRKESIKEMRKHGQISLREIPQFSVKSFQITYRKICLSMILSTSFAPDKRRSWSHPKEVGISGAAYSQRTSKHRLNWKYLSAHILVPQADSMTFFSDISNNSTKCRRLILLSD